MFGLTSGEGNRGEDVKEYYFYLDATPTGSYMKLLYKYPQAAYPHGALLGENRRRGSSGLEFELIDLELQFGSWELGGIWLARPCCLDRWPGHSMRWKD